MGSRSPSQSEGEVMSSDSDSAKAKTSLSSRNNTKVDRHTRLYRPPPARHRSRSRSPYRAPRGEKRRRDDDYSKDRPRHDTRTFQARYEDEHDSHGRHASHDYRESKRSRAFSRSRSRSRSRSPYRHSRAKDGYEDSRSAQIERRASPKADRQLKVSTRSKHSGESHEDRPAPSTAQAEKDGESKQSSTDKYDLQAVEGPSSDHAVSASVRDKATDGSTDKPLLDEAAQIDERRKRREAIRNKYRGQATPLLVQALHLGAESSRPTPDIDSLPTSPDRSGTRQSTPNVDGELSREASPKVDSPGNSLPTGPASPADDMFANEQELANGEIGSPAGDEPSAADYDPTVDMQEERARHDRRLFKEDDQSLVEADAKVAEKVTEPEVTAPASSTAEFDMFAEDDDDMFAEAPMKPKTETKVAQTLDERMMDNWDDHEGYYITILGELIEGRYQVTQNLGRGMFSSVVRATDSKTSQHVAIKIVRNNESMRKAGIKEIDILKDIAVNDPDDKKHVIRLLRSFDHKGHLCMVFENLSMNLREVLKKFGRDVGINIKAIRAYAQQLFLGLSLLRKCQYLHADLKPDNILVNESRNTLKVCDLGSASPITENATAPYLVSRFYRAPEVILGITYDYGIDMWSIGCTLFELYTGKILFTGRNNNNMLRSIMECRGKFPHKMLRRGTLTYDYFDDLLNFKAQEADKTTGRIVTKLIDIKAKPVRDLRSRLVPKGKKLDETERKEVELFVDLLDKCLDLRPEKRITPTEALKHPFILRAKN